MQMTQMTPTENSPWLSVFHFSVSRKDLKFVSGVEEEIKNLVELVNKVR